MSSQLDVKFSDCQSRLSTFIHENIDRRDPEADDEEDRKGPKGGEPVFKRRQRLFTSLLAEFFDLLRAANEGEREALIERVDAVVDEAVSTNNLSGGYDARWIFEDGKFNSFAHAEGEIIRKKPGLIFSAHVLDQLSWATAELFKSKGEADKADAACKDIFGELKSWDALAVQKPHQSTTLLSRFNDKFPSSWSSPYAQAAAQAVYEARCEVSSDTVMAPINLFMSANHSCVATAGWYDSTPGLAFVRLSEDGKLRCHGLPVGLANYAPFITTEESRRLLFIADDQRIKSFSWENDLPVHTLASNHFQGPIHAFSNGSLVRAGKGKLGVWVLDSQPTHGSEGNERIGGELPLQDDYRSYYGTGRVEFSSGSLPTSVVSLESTLKDWNIDRWIAHPSSPNAMITVMKEKCAMIAIDVEHGGKVGTKFLGQGGYTRSLSTDPFTAPNMFVSGCIDGHIRLWDTRQLLPVLTIENDDSSTPSVAFAHPDGVPTIFSGGGEAAVIKVWDVRGRQMVYELATGNNDLVDLAWDGTRNTLWAATECRFMDRMGNPRGYRPIKLPKFVKERKKGVNSETSDKDDDDDDDYDEEYERAWPKKAYHKEDYFGDVYDAGDHVILRYKFKSDADPSVVPAYNSVETY